MQSQHFPLNTLFKPSPSMKIWLRVSIALGIGIVLLFSFVPAALFSGMPATFSVVILWRNSPSLRPALVLGGPLL